MKKIRLIRIFNFLNPKVAIVWLLFFCFKILADLIVSQSIRITELVLIVSIVLIFHPLHYTKQFEWSKRTISYREYIFFSRRVGSVAVEFTVADIFMYELHQTRIERLFNVGHITFSGTTTFKAKKTSKSILERRVHRLYGIAKFREFSQEFQDSFKENQTQDSP